jgi:transcriptional regulator with XRE-family HTH domain
MSHRLKGDLLGFGACVKARRQELKLSQTELAARVGYRQERISMIEHGKYGMPSIAALSDLAAALEIGLEHLLDAAGFRVTMDAEELAMRRPAGEERLHRLTVERERLVTTLDDLNMRLGKTCARMEEVDRLRDDLNATRARVAHQVSELRGQPAEPASR